MIIKITLCLSTKKDVSFEEISSRLNIQPTEKRKRSEFPLISRQLGYDVNEWCLEKRTNSNYDVTELFDEFEYTIEDVEELNNIVNEYEMRVTINIVIEGEKNNMPYINLSSQNIQFAKKINAEIGFDLYID